MSIEALLQAHIEALKDNTAAVLLLESTLVGRAGKAPKEEKPVVEKAEKPQKTEVKKEEAKAEEKKAIVEEKPDPADDIPEFGVPYETVRALVLKLAGAGKREEIKALNTKHGIANLKVLLNKEDDFSTVNDQVKLEAVYADLQVLEG